MTGQILPKGVDQNGPCCPYCGVVWYEHILVGSDDPWEYCDKKENKKENTDH